MNTNSRKIALGLSGMLLCVLFIAGCGDSVSSRISSATEAHVRKMAVMYKMYSNRNQYMGPESAEQLKGWVQGHEKVADQLAKFGIDVNNFDSFLVSDRTGDKLEFRWSVKSAPMAPPYPVVFEPNALDGSRHVGMAGGETLVVEDDNLYDKLKEGEYNPDDFEQKTAGTGQAR